MKDGQQLFLDFAEFIRGHHLRNHHGFWIFHHAHGEDLELMPGVPITSAAKRVSKSAPPSSSADPAQPRSAGSSTLLHAAPGSFLSISLYRDVEDLPLLREKWGAQSGVYA